MAAQGSEESVRQRCELHTTVCLLARHTAPSTRWVLCKPVCKQLGGRETGGEQAVCPDSKVCS